MRPNYIFTGKEKLFFRDNARTNREKRAAGRFVGHLLGKEPLRSLALGGGVEWKIASGVEKRESVSKDLPVLHGGKTRGNFEMADLKKGSQRGKIVKRVLRRIWKGGSGKRCKLKGREVSLEP